MTSIEDTMRQVFREELARHEERSADRIAERVKALVATGDRLLGPNDDLSGYSWATVKRWVRLGLLKRYGKSRSLRVSEIELRIFLAKHESTGMKAPTDADIHDLAVERANRR